MKIKTVDIAYEDFLKIKEEKRFKPKKPNIFFRALLKIVSKGDLRATNFKCKKEGMEKLGNKEPCFIIMNHSAFIDLEIAASILYPRPFNIITTEDGFIGKRWLLRELGCIPTKKFITDYHIFNAMKEMVKKGSSILMYPEASYSFDGTATTLPESLAKCIKMLNIPVIMIRTFGAFARDPLYNNLQVRKVDVSCVERYLLSKDYINELSIEEINNIVKEQFNFDNWKWQQDNKIKIAEPFRADYLHRVLYKCPHCLDEQSMVGKGTEIRCTKCDATYELDEYGYLVGKNITPKFNHVPDWFKWEREEVRKEIENNTYKLEIDVEIRAFKGMKCLYNIGEGHLTHDINGFHLVGKNNSLDVKVPSKAQYSLYSDYYWYELGDMIAVSDKDVTYYCFPKNNENVAAKTRLAVEEIYKIQKNKSN